MAAEGIERDAVVCEQREIRWGRWGGGGRDMSVTKVRGACDGHGAH